MTDYSINGRAAVRDAVVALLAASVPEVAGQVFTGRTWPTPPEGFPALLVYAWRESASLLSSAGTVPTYRVTASVDVIARAEAQDIQEPEDGDSRLEPILEGLELSVKNAILASQGFFALAGVEFCTAMETQVQISSEADRSVGDVQITFSLQWQETWPPRVTDALTAVRLLKARQNGEPQVGADITLPSP